MSLEELVRNSRFTVLLGNEFRNVLGGATIGNQERHAWPRSGAAAKHSIDLRRIILRSTIQHEKEGGGLGRPKGRTLPVRISVALSPVLFRAVSALATQQSSSVASVVRRAVTEFVRAGAVPSTARQADDIREAHDLPPRPRSRSR
jgi:hypothetical protein